MASLEPVTSRRKGIEKPIFIVAALTLAIMFVALYYSAVSGWTGDLVNQFNSAVARLG
ncbi:MAG: hypothetical protein ABEI58_04080 [Candidatus Nanohaloarchaea archaeon]